MRHHPGGFKDKDVISCWNNLDDHAYWKSLNLDHFVWLSIEIMRRLNSKIFRNLDPRKWSLNLSISDWRASKIIRNDSKLETIPRENNIENPVFDFCVGVWVGGQKWPAAFNLTNSFFLIWITPFIQKIRQFFDYPSSHPSFNKCATQLLVSCLFKITCSESFYFDSNRKMTI